jgi:hypothetical protein
MVKLNDELFEEEEGETFLLVSRKDLIQFTPSQVTRFSHVLHLPTFQLIISTYFLTAEINYRKFNCILCNI